MVLGLKWKNPVGTKRPKRLGAKDQLEMALICPRVLISARIGARPCIAVHNVQSPRSWRQLGGGVSQFVSYGPELRKLKKEALQIPATKRRREVKDESGIASDRVGGYAVNADADQLLSNICCRHREVETLRYNPVPKARKVLPCRIVVDIAIDSAECGFDFLPRGLAIRDEATL
ncbi:hypothetical protein BV25DRAFT_1903913 [Artomyces pyxidatus]|uniref:Uncharacterized protein n=1 Tax=Artomyces pyxidatus TaxID=48021 RepID=A0ACB8SE51_9AGAM|nr:hypothetical protein BV25DRAFT_1903913 [Artomyces pyxidatus]